MPEGRDLGRRKEAFCEMVGVGDIADQLNIDTNRDAVRKGVENERPGMREVELQMRRRVRSSEFRLAVLGFHEFDGCRLDAQPLSEESSQTPRAR